MSWAENASLWLDKSIDTHSAMPVSALPLHLSDGFLRAELEACRLRCFRKGQMKLVQSIEMVIARLDQTACLKNENTHLSLHNLELAEQNVELGEQNVCLRSMIEFLLKQNDELRKNTIDLTGSHELSKNIENRMGSQ